MLQSLSIASAVAVTSALYGIPGIESAPMWRTFAAASNMAGRSRRITPLMAAELANVLGVRWAMTGEIYPSPDGYTLIVDFIPAKASVVPFRYQSSLRPELLDERLDQALEQFLRYARHPAPQLGRRTRAVNQSELFKLAEEVDREYGWFSPPAPGKAQAAFASLFALDPRLASLLFDPVLYAAAAEPAPAEASKPAVAVGAEPGVKPALTLPNAINPVPDRKPPKQVAPPPPSRSPGIPENSKWVPLMVPPIPALPPEQQFRQEQTGADVNRRVTSRPSAFFSGHRGGSDSSALLRAPRARYVLQLFASANEAEARQVAQDLMRAGVPAKVSAVKAGRETLYRVSGGAYDYPDTASAAGDALVALRTVDEYWVRAEALTAAIASPTPAAKTPRALETAGSAAGEFQVQVFASFNREKAVAFAEGLREIGLQARIEPLKVTGKGDCYRVRLTGYQSRKEAIVAAEQLRAQGRIREYWIVS